MLENRTVESIQDVIPTELKKDIDIKEFADLNGLIISGSYTRIEEIKQFLRQIDLPVPVVLIDLMIVEINKDFNVEAGLKLGVRWRKTSLPQPQALTTRAVQDLTPR